MASAALALMVVTLAVWWIGRSLVDPVASSHSAAALLRGTGAKRLDASDDRLALQAPEPAAVERARILVASEPLAAEAYAVLALDARQAGQEDRAARLMELAASWWPRDLLVQSWLLERSLRRGDRDAAVARFDLIARVRPDTLDAMTEAVAPVLVDPAFADAFARRLAARPPWRTRFIDIAVRQWRAPAGVIGLLDRLQTPPSLLDPAEMRPYLTKLLATEQPDKAYLAWLRSLPQARLASLGYLYNGRFQYPVSDMPFDWQMPSIPSAQATVSGAPSQRVLTVGLFGGRVALQPVQHDLALAPGSYRLTGRVSTDRLEAEHGVRWRLACLDAPGRVLASSELFRGSFGWRDFATDFTLEEGGCSTQVLGLEVYAPTTLEQEASGIASFSTLTIQPR